MKKHVSSKKALLASIMSLVLCCAMLMGTTFAWFTDSVTSGVNRIQAGNLDVEFEYSADMNNWQVVQGDDSIFDENALWEPGHTEVVYLKITNVGSLALKYLMAIGVSSEVEGINVDNAAFKLSDYIQFGQVEDVTDAYVDRAAARAAVDGQTKKISDGYSITGDMAAAAVAAAVAATAKYIALVAYMPEDVGNEANYKAGSPLPKIELGMKINATQMTNESDSFDRYYDAEAVVEGISIVNVVVPAPVIVDASGVLTATAAPVASSDGIVEVTVPAGVQTTADTAGSATLNLEVKNETPEAAGFSIDLGDPAAEVIGYSIKIPEVATTNTVKIPVQVFVGKGLTISAVYHNGVAMDAADWDYDATTGNITIRTATFSNFAIEYKACAAMIGDTYYDTFAAAVAVAESGDTIKLASNAVITEQVTLPAGVTLDGANYTIVANNSAWSTNADEKYMLVAGNGVTIKNVTLDGAAKAPFGMQFYNAANGVMQNITVMNTKSCGLSINTAKVTATGGLTLKDCGWGNAVNVSYGQNIATGDNCVFDASAANITGVSTIYSDEGDVNRATTAGKTITITVPTDWMRAEEAAYGFIPAAAKIGETKYETLAAAYNGAASGATITLLKDSAGDGIVFATGKDITVDFAGHTYTVDGQLVGSTGTENQAFQLLRDSNITLKNGTLTSTKAQFIVQNYANLTLDNMTLDGSNYPCVYTLSNNNGTSFINNSKIIARNVGYAFDLFYWPSNSYGDGVFVTVDAASVIQGRIQRAHDGTDAANFAAKCVLTTPDRTPTQTSTGAKSITYTLG